MKNPHFSYEKKNPKQEIGMDFDGFFMSNWGLCPPVSYDFHRSENHQPEPETSLQMLIKYHSTALLVYGL